ncbi:geranylgeranyl transferase type-2 subunit alpha-like isoform X2 [Xenia sp. Carnegie-2017]|nr:geranylgeranyl transferase type-2 subunit alpha-like isoform X2 [Xenia sp. Carnegie-2017]
MWNYRREMFEYFKKERESVQLRELCLKELAFLERCLPVNPKSYGIWHHRSWMMLFMSTPDWKKELHLCNVYLSYDERNFHCWDYRRFVVKQAQISAEKEFQYTSDKIRENFSNYSSWHYRSKLLPKIHPASADDGERIEENALLEEFQLVQNAFFTDPNDQSAWFYHRWLLGRAKNDIKILQAYARRHNDRLVVYILFNKQVKKEVVSALSLTVNGEKDSLDWYNPTNNVQPSSIWIASSKVSDEDALHLNVTHNELNVNITLDVNELEIEGWKTCYDEADYSFRSELTTVHHAFLENELESCCLLLEEEPDNKWTILTIVLLMRAINPMNYSNEVEGYLKKLSEIDYYRRGYYNDLDSKYKLENTIERHFVDCKGKQNFLPRVIQLSHMDLTTLYHMDRLLLMTDIDLSNNRLRSLDGCNMLQSARKICLDNNNLEVIVNKQGLNLPYLKELSLNNNNIGRISCFLALQKCTNLKELNVKNNPIEGVLNWHREIKQMIPWLEKLNGEGI